jgi:hypothetical protein
MRCLLSQSSVLTVVNRSSLLNYILCILPLSVLSQKSLSQYRRMLYTIVATNVFLCFACCLYYGDRVDASAATINILRSLEEIFD